MRDVSQQLIQDRIRDLRENTDFVATLFESLIGYAIIAADFDGNVIAYNEGARQIYGYAPEEIIGQQKMEIFFPKDFIEAGALQRVIDDLMGKGRVAFGGEKVRKGGERFPAQVLFTLTKDRSGRVVGFIEIAQDLTERKRIEAELARRAAALEQSNAELASSRAFLAGILDSTVDAILTVDEHGVIQSLNKSTIQLFGYDENELIGNGIDILFSDTALGKELGRCYARSYVEREHERGRDHEIMKDKLGTFFAEERERERERERGIEARGVTKSGAMFDCEIAIKEIVGLPERTARFTVIIRDITEHKRAENELKRFSAELESRVAERTHELASSRAFLAAILDSTVDAILTVDEHGDIQSVNKGTTDLFGCNENDLLGANLSDLLHESYRSEFQKDISHISATKRKS